VCSGQCEVEERAGRKFDEAKTQTLWRWKQRPRVEQAVMLTGAAARQSGEGCSEDIKRTRRCSADERPVDEWTDWSELADRQTGRQAADVMCGRSRTSGEASEGH
jgi:hypothetical protein